MDHIATSAAAAVLNATQVADLLDAVSQANSVMAAELDRAVGSPAPAGQRPVDRFTGHAARLRPGGAARARLSAVDPDLLLAGTSVWMARRRRPVPSAAGRARARWTGGLSA